MRPCQGRDDGATPFTRSTSRSRASAQAGFIRPPCPGQHWGLRPCFARRPPPSFGWRAILASWQQPAGALCTDAEPEQHRREAPSHRSRSPSVCTRPRDTTPRASSLHVQLLPRAPTWCSPSGGSASPLWPASIEVMQRTFNPRNRERYPGGPPSFALSPPWTGSERGMPSVACGEGGPQPSGSELRMARQDFAGSSNSRTSPFEGEDDGAIPSPAANVNAELGVRSTEQRHFRRRHSASLRPYSACRIPRSERPVVKQDHVCPTNRSRRCNSFPGDHSSLLEPRLGEPLASWRHQ